MRDICLGFRGGVLALLLLTFPVTSLAQPAALLVSTVPLDGTAQAVRKISLTGEDLGIFALVGLNGALGLALDQSVTFTPRTSVTAPSTGSPRLVPISASSPLHGNRISSRSSSRHRL